MKESIQKEINQQINKEFYSSYLYLSMAAYFETTSLKGFANWMQIQAQEELAHAMKFYTFAQSRGGNIRLKTIEEPPTQWSTPQAVFEKAYEHEKSISQSIDQLVDLAIQEKDHATNSFLQWFVNEQVEEEESVSEVVNKLKLIGDSGNGLFIIDQELAKRVYVAPVDATGK